MSKATNARAFRTLVLFTALILMFQNCQDSGGFQIRDLDDAFSMSSLSSTGDSLSGDNQNGNAGQTGGQTSTPTPAPTPSPSTEMIGSCQAKDCTHRLSKPDDFLGLGISNNPKTTYCMDRDVDFQNQPRERFTSYIYTLNLNGCGFKIKNVKITGQPFFPKVFYSSFHNLNFENIHGDLVPVQEATTPGSKLYIGEDAGLIVGTLYGSELVGLQASSQVASSVTPVPSPYFDTMCGLLVGKAFNSNLKRISARFSKFTFKKCHFAGPLTSHFQYSYVIGTLPRKEDPVLPFKIEDVDIRVNDLTFDVFQAAAGLVGLVNGSSLVPAQIKGNRFEGNITAGNTTDCGLKSSIGSAPHLPCKYMGGLVGSLSQDGAPIEIQNNVFKGNLHAIGVSSASETQINGINVNASIDNLPTVAGGVGAIAGNLFASFATSSPNWSSNVFEGQIKVEHSVASRQQNAGLQAGRFVGTIAGSARPIFPASAPALSLIVDGAASAKPYHFNDQDGVTDCQIAGTVYPAGLYTVRYLPRVAGQTSCTRIGISCYSNNIFNAKSMTVSIMDGKLNVDSYLHPNPPTTDAQTIFSARLQLHAENFPDFQGLVYTGSPEQKTRILFNLAAATRPTCE